MACGHRGRSLASTFRYSLSIPLRCCGVLSCLHPRLLEIRALCDIRRLSREAADWMLHTVRLPHHLMMCSHPRYIAYIALL